MNNTLSVALSTNDGYAPYLSTAIYSIIANSDSNKHYDLFVFFSSLSKDNIELLSALQTENVAIHFVNFDNFTKEYDSLFYTWAHYTKESYYRLFLPEYFGEMGIDKFIYLDVDLVVNCDIGELMNEADNSRSVYGALNYSTADDAEYIQSLGLSYLNYINKAIEIIKQRRKFIYIDQDILNLICSGDIGLVSPSWNMQWNNLDCPEKFMPEVRDAVMQITQPHIVHYTIDKPWNCMLNHYGEFYHKYAAMNPVYKRFMK